MADDNLKTLILDSLAVKQAAALVPQADALINGNAGF